jgi:hypothetical protein
MPPAHLNTGDDINLVFGVLSAVLALLTIVLATATWKLQKQVQHANQVHFQHIIFYANINLPPSKARSKGFDISTDLSQERKRAKSMPPPYDIGDEVPSGEV